MSLLSTLLYRRLCAELLGTTRIRPDTMHVNAAPPATLPIALTMTSWLYAPDALPVVMSRRCMEKLGLFGLWQAMHRAVIIG